VFIRHQLHQCSMSNAQQLPLQWCQTRVRLPRTKCTLPLLPARYSRNSFLSLTALQCVLVIRESFTKEYGSRVFHSSPCGPLLLHIEPNQLSLLTRTHCILLSHMSEKASATSSKLPHAATSAPNTLPQLLSPPRIVHLLPYHRGSCPHAKKAAFSNSFCGYCPPYTPFVDGGSANL